MEWLSNQTQIVTTLSELEIPMENFTWSFTNVYTDAADGSKVPAVFVKGYSTILCVLEVLTANEDEYAGLRKPYIPKVDDEVFFYTSVKKLDRIDERQLAVR